MLHVNTVYCGSGWTATPIITFELIIYT